MGRLRVSSCKEKDNRVVCFCFCIQFYTVDVINAKILCLSCFICVDTLVYPSQQNFIPVNKFSIISGCFPVFLS